MPEPQVVAVIAKNAVEEVRVALTEFNGHELVDVRIYASFDDSDAERRPTKKGISLKREKLPELIQGLEQALREGEG
ncbi:transcriptional coactivator p15/PC4 family protein [Methylobacterium organophilum]|uniref:Transcriptional coactivator p15 (PC4) C-terminal domain-containing protein n=1 Tax=Methylobacterium organophilum TaxID=410 RepID=A0ABQ4TBT9_METOR|nr:transcriptional coactivator p15/PC4 family protein [Methylobacterium organophilum]GJE29127.1 hypothetical protein LKMONMHP_4006 [Methylobacterium organophilum]